ncbi:MAG TPA: CoA pyrophosphatase [Propioniciclava tarda]|nr:CoA pyrophosphatase [Propioniciclava tarda]HQD60419.1 CoA pyrophosphatase [Propioniciclava tarda]
MLEGLATPSAMEALMIGRGASGTMRRASVLALLWQDASCPTPASSTESTSGLEPPGGLRVVLIEKSTHLRNHAGQVAFPGGRIEPEESPVQAALREASEEVGIEASGVEVLGELPPASVMASGFDVHTIVAWWTRPVALRPVDVGEVAAVHQVAVADLLDPANRATWVLGQTHSGPVFCVGDLFIWGLTGHLLSGLFELAGWTRPWDASRCLEIPPRFFRGRT